MIFIFSISDFGHPKLLKSQYGHPVMKILAKSLPSCTHDLDNCAKFGNLAFSRIC